MFTTPVSTQSQHSSGMQALIVKNVSQIATAFNTKLSGVFPKGTYVQVTQAKNKWYCTSVVYTHTHTHSHTASTTIYIIKIYTKSYDQPVCHPRCTGRQSYQQRPVPSSYFVASLFVCPGTAQTETTLGKPALNDCFMKLLYCLL